MLTHAQALNNLAIAVERVSGTKQEHIAWQESIDLLKTLLPVETPVAAEETK